MEEMEVTNLYCQCASINQMLKPMIDKEVKHWPEVESQEKLRKLLQFDPKFHFQSNVLSSHKLLPPIVYRKTLYKLLVKSIENANEEFHDEFMEDYLSVLEEDQNTLVEEVNNGCYSYTTPFISPFRIPFFVRRGHNEVGMKVWNAGLYLIEVFYCLIQQSIEKSNVESACNYLQDLWFSNNVSNAKGGKIFFELGSGIGMTGIIAERGLFLPLSTYLPSLCRKEEFHSSLLFPKFYLTDYSEEIVESINKNIELSVNPPSFDKSDVLPDNASCNTDVGKTIHEIKSSFNNEILSELLTEQNKQMSLEGKVFNWKDYSSEEFHQVPINCLFAADCTYSEDLNLSIVDVFEDYLKNNVLNSASTKKGLSIETEDRVSLPLRLLEENIPFVLIACTVRNPDTFQHFLSCVQSKKDLLSFDLTDEINAERIKFPYNPPFVYESYSADIKLFCIVHSNSIDVNN